MARRLHEIDDGDIRNGMAGCVDVAAAEMLAECTWPPKHHCWDPQMYCNAPSS